MSTAQQLGLIGNSIKVQSLPTASAETFGAGNRFYTLIGQQEGYITGHTYHTVVANDVYSWEDVSCGNYNMLDNIPVINQDLTASDFTPVANTYYRHTGSTTSTFTQGVIYCYDGTEYKALDGAGGISDVQVNGTSVVTDGVANIPAASTSVNGVVTTGAQTIGGSKTFRPNVNLSHGFKMEHNGDTAVLRPLSAYTGQIGTDNYPIGGVTATHFGLKKSWSSGTSGSVTLTQSGTYQIRVYDETEGNYIDFGFVYVGLDKNTMKGIVYNDTIAYRLIIGTDGAISSRKIDLSNNTGNAYALTIEYRSV